MSFPTKQGSGSGIDADLLDGMDSTFFIDIPSRLGYIPANKAGDTMLNMLTMFRDPEEDLEVATKAYVDGLLDDVGHICRPAIAWFNDNPLNYPEEPEEPPDPPLLGVLIGAGSCVDFRGGSVTVTYDEETQIATITVGGAPLTIIVEHNDLEKVTETIGLNFITYQDEDVNPIEEDLIEEGQLNVTVYSNQMELDVTAPITAAQHFPFVSSNFLTDHPNAHAGHNFIHTYTHPGSGTPNLLVHFPKASGALPDGYSFVLLLVIAGTPSGRGANLFIDEATGVEYDVGKGTPQVVNNLMYKAGERAWSSHPGGHAYRVPPGFKWIYSPNNTSRYGPNAAYDDLGVSILTGSTKAIMIHGVMMPSAVLGSPSYYYSIGKY